MRKEIKNIISDVKLFFRKACYTTLIAVALYFVIWLFPTLRSLMEPFIIIPIGVLFGLLAVLVLAILADQIGKRHRMPSRVERDIAKHTDK
jgi:hypothetical protein